MKVLAIIPARAGSKCIPRKNVRLLNGKPLLAYSIEYAKKSSIINRIVVSTDSSEFAQIANKFGAHTPFLRPKFLADDLVEDFPVALNALEEMEKHDNMIYDYVVWLRPTSPFRPEGLIERGIKLIEENPNATSVRAVTKSKEHPFRQWVISQGYINPFVGNSSREIYNIPRQELPDVYFQTGDIEIIRRKTLLTGSISGDHVLPIFIDQNQVLDIDEESDWNRAEEY